MIFVTAGTSRFPFERLEKIASELNLLYPKETIFFQTPHPTISFSKPFRSKEYLSSFSFNNYLSKADIIVTHAGYATVMQALRFSHVKPIVVPRLKYYQEHVNDHQLYFAQYMSRKKLISIVEKPEEIEKVIKKNSYDSDRVKKYLKTVRKKQEQLIKYLRSLT